MPAPIPILLIGAYIYVYATTYICLSYYIWILLHGVVLYFIQSYSVPVFTFALDTICFNICYWVVYLFHKVFVIII
jgi:hypothetical protein